MNLRQRYSAEFKAEAVRMVRESGQAVSTMAKQMGIPPGTLAHWVDKDAERSARPAVDGESTQAELARLRKEVAELRMERDILKKATAYFAKESLPGTRS
jgi:transposase